jgi:hypothetical protein
MHKVILVMLLSVVSNCAMAQWEEILVSGNQTLYVNRATIKKVGSRVQMWSMTDFSGKTSFPSIAELREYDCKKNQERTLTSDIHARHMGKGAILDSLKPSADEPNDMSELSPQDQIPQLVLNIACGKK